MIIAPNEFRLPCRGGRRGSPLVSKRRRRSAWGVSGLVVAVAILAQQPVDEAAAQQDLATKTATIDRDRVSRHIADAAESKSRNVHRFSKSAAAPMQRVPVPVFLPLESLDDYEDSENKSAVATSRGIGGSKSVGGPGSLFVPLSDGYTVSRAFDRFDLVVRGTNRIFADGRDGAKAADTPASDYVNEFSQNEDGGVITFGYVGAHYSALFECKSGGFQCVTAAEAKQIVDELLLCGFDDRCVERGPDNIGRQ